MNHKALLPALGVCLTAALLSGQEHSASPIFTAEQAAAGRVVYEKTCGRCHTVTLMGRAGNPDERPEVSSLSDADQKFLRQFGPRVPPLAGKAFLDRWGNKTAAQLVARFQEAKFSFNEARLTDDEDIVRITAYVLKMNGAKPGSQALTRTTGAVVNSVVE